MAKYKLLSPHYTEEDKLLETGTEVGDGTPHLWTRPPTPEMEALDADGKHRLEREKKRAGERVSPIEDLPLTMEEAAQQYDAQVEAGGDVEDPKMRTTQVRHERDERQRGPAGQFLPKK